MSKSFFMPSEKQTRIAKRLREIVVEMATAQLAAGEDIDKVSRDVDASIAWFAQYRPVIESGVCPQCKGRLGSAPYARTRVFHELRCRECPWRMIVRRNVMAAILDIVEDAL